MDPDAPPPAPPRTDDVIPPPTPAGVRALALAGAGLAAAAVAVGLAAAAATDSPPWPVATARLWLVGVGCVVAGAAVSRRPTMPVPWLLAAATALLGAFGTPDHWDSARFLLRVLAAVALGGAVLAALPRPARIGAVSALILFHFVGIFTATTAPPTQGGTPWVTEQVYNRVYSPYLQFVYLRNAYHFYSPEPGPARLLAFLVKTRTGEQVGPDGVPVPTYDREWVVVPKRPDDVKDPLAVSYFRRLALTEQLSGSYPALQAGTAEANDVRQRRVFASFRDADGYSKLIPAHPYENLLGQYRVPYPGNIRYTLPSYAQHVIWDKVKDKPDDVAGRTTVMIYHMEHRTLGVAELSDNKRDKGAGRFDPYAPGTFRTYFLGEYKIDGTLVDPRDPLLYWLVPVYLKDQRAGGAPADPDLYEDLLSAHAGKKFDWRSLR